MKIAYFGNHNVGYLCLNRLIKHNILPKLIIVQETYENESIKYKSVKELAQKNRIETYIFNKSQKKDLIELLSANSIDLIISVAWRYIFEKDILSIPKIGAINFHGSLLPRCRGANPTNWAIISGERETGVTVHHIDEGIDTGDIIIQKSVSIEWDDTAYTLRLKQDKISEILMDDIVKYIQKEEFPRIKQDNTKATSYKKRKPEDGVINWSRFRSVEMYNFVRAITKPYPGAFSYINKKKIYIWKVLPIETKDYKTSPGVVIAFDNGFPIVSTLDGCVKMLDFECESSDFHFAKGMYFDS